MWDIPSILKPHHSLLIMLDGRKEFWILLRIIYCWEFWVGQIIFTFTNSKLNNFILTLSHFWWKTERKSNGSLLATVPSINTPEYLFWPTASLQKYILKDYYIDWNYFSKPWQLFLVNSSHMNSKIAPLNTSIGAIRTSKWLFSRVNHLMIFQLIKYKCKVG